MDSSYLPSDAGALFADLSVPWLLAGGWAIDTFLRLETRPHADLDIAILRKHQGVLRGHLDGWDLRVATAPGVLETWDGSQIPDELHVIWCRPAPDAPWALELLLNDHTDQDWLFRRDHNIKMPLDRIGRVSPDGLPYLIPEIVLLYKAKGVRETDEHDLLHCLPYLTTDSRTWLREAIAKAHGSGHPWLSRLISP